MSLAEGGTLPRSRPKQTEAFCVRLVECRELINMIFASKCSKQLSECIEEECDQASLTCD